MNPCRSLALIFTLAAAMALSSMTLATAHPHHPRHASDAAPSALRHHHGGDTAQSADRPAHHRRHAASSDQAQAAPHHRHHSADTAQSADKPARRHHHSADSNTEQTPHRAKKHDQEADSARSRHHNKHDVESSDASTAQPRHRSHAQRLHDEHLAQLATSRHKKAHNRRQETANAKHQAHLANLAAMELASHPHKAHLTHKQKLAQKRYQQHLARLAAKAYATHLARLYTQQNAEHKARQARLAAQEARKHAHLARLKALHDSEAALSPSSSIHEWNDYSAGVPVKIIMVDLNDQRVRVSALIAKNGIGTSEPFPHMIARTHPDVAVTGTFFSLDNLHPVGDIVINGNLAYFGGMGTALCITPTNKADMITVPWGHHYNWSGYDCVVACGPRLLEHGQIVLDPHAERFKDQHMLAPNSRIAVGITRDNKLVFVMTHDPIYLGRLAKVMRDLGCQQAMNLDAGTSTGFYCDGHLLARPGRRLTNAIVVYANHPAIARTAGSAGNDQASSKPRPPA